MFFPTEPEPPPKPEPPDPPTTKQTRLDAQAITQRWDITPEQKRDIINRAVQVARNPKTKPRELATIMRMLLAAEKQNQDDQHKLLDASVIRDNNRLASIAHELGIDPDLIEAIEAGPNPDASDAPQPRNPDPAE